MSNKPVIYVGAGVVVGALVWWALSQSSSDQNGSSNQQEQAALGTTSAGGASATGTNSGAEGAKGAKDGQTRLLKSGELLPTLAQPTPGKSVVIPNEPPKALTQQSFGKELKENLPMWSLCGHVLNESLRQMKEDAGEKVAPPSGAIQLLSPEIQQQMTGTLKVVFAPDPHESLTHKRPIGLLSAVFLEDSNLSEPARLSYAACLTSQLQRARFEFTEEQSKHGLTYDYRFAAGELLLDETL